MSPKNTVVIDGTLVYSSVHTSQQDVLPKESIIEFRTLTVSLPINEFFLR